MMTETTTSSSSSAVESARLEAVTHLSLSPEEPTELDKAQREAIAQMVRQARDAGIALTGPDGLLRALTAQVVEAALDEELNEHLGYGQTPGSRRWGTGPQPPYAQVITGVTLHSRMRGSARERLAGLGSQTSGDIMKIRRLTASAVAAVVIAVVGTVVPQQAQAAGCTVTTPNIHFSTTEPGRFNFKPLVKCTTPEKYQLFLNHRVQYLSGSKWVTTVWTKKTLNQSLSYVRVSLSRTCTTGTFRGQARYLGDSGFYSEWKTSNTFVVKSCGGGGSWSVPPEVEFQ